MGRAALALRPQDGPIRRPVLNTLTRTHQALRRAEAQNIVDIGYKTQIVRHGDEYALRHFDTDVVSASAHSSLSERLHLSSGGRYSITTAHRVTTLFKTAGLDVHVVAFKSRRDPEYSHWRLWVNGLDYRHVDGCTLIVGWNEDRERNFVLAPFMGDTGKVLARWSPTRRKPAKGGLSN